MIRVDGKGNIQYTRGDDETITVDLVEMPSGASRSLANNETLIMTVRHSGLDTYGFGAVLFTTSTTGPSARPVLAIRHSDTNTAAVGRYVYDIEIRKMSGSTITSRTTVVGGDKDAPLEFFIVPEITAG